MPPPRIGNSGRCYGRRGVPKDVYQKVAQQWPDGSIDGCPQGRIPKGLSPWDRMERKLLTKRGRALYKKRGVLVEPVFGQVKEGQGFRRFMRRGLGVAQSEWSLAGMTHNLLKLWALAKPHGTKRGTRPFWGPTSGRWNWTGRPLLSPIAPTPVLVSSPTGL